MADCPNQPFWPTDQEVWFAQVKAQLSTRGITVQKKRFDYVISSLSSKFATEVWNLFLKPPAERIQAHPTPLPHAAASRGQTQYLHQCKQLPPRALLIYNGCL